MSVFAMFVTSSITARSHHITHVTLCSSQSRESADQLKLSGGARVQPPAARLSHKMGKPGSSPTNRQYRHADRQCMDWPLWTLCWPYGVRCPVITWSSVLPCHIFTNIEVLTVSVTASVSISFDIILRCVESKYLSKGNVEVNVDIYLFSMSQRKQYENMKYFWLSF